MYSHDLNVHCEICAYSRFCETKELKGENNSVLRSLLGRHLQHIDELRRAFLATNG